MLLVQIAGGLTGIAVAYAMHRFVERKYERIDAQLRAEHKIEMEKLRQAQLAAIRKQGKSGAMK
jgi:hypothetical protein